MADNIHPVVELLVARMKSHPEEFGPRGGGRWADWLNLLTPLVTEEERVMLRKLSMDTIHEEVLDELMNGEERRAREKRERYLEMQRLMAQAQQNTLRPGQYAQVPNLSALQGLSTAIPSPNGAEGLRIHSNGDIQIGNETLNEGTLRKIKKALGL